MIVRDYTKSNPKAVRVWETEEGLILMDCFKKGDPAKTLTTVSRYKGETHWHIDGMRTNCDMCDKAPDGEACGRIANFRQQIAHERAYKLFCERNGIHYSPNTNKNWKV